MFKKWFNSRYIHRDKIKANIEKAVIKREKEMKEAFLKEKEIIKGQYDEEYQIMVMTKDAEINSMYRRMEELICRNQEVEKIYRGTMRDGQDQKRVLQDVVFQVEQLFENQTRFLQGFLTIQQKVEDRERGRVQEHLTKKAILDKGVSPV